MVLKENYSQLLSNRAFTLLGRDVANHLTLPITHSRYLECKQITLTVGCMDVVMRFQMVLVAPERVSGVRYGKYAIALSLAASKLYQSRLALEVDAGRTCL